LISRKNSENCPYQIANKWEIILLLLRNLILKFGQNLIKIVTKLSTDFSKGAILFLIYLPADKGKYVLGKIRILEY